MKCIACIIGILLSAVSTLASDYKLTFCVKAEDALSEDGVCVLCPARMGATRARVSK